MRKGCDRTVHVRGQIDDAYTAHEHKHVYTGVAVRTFTLSGELPEYLVVALYNNLYCVSNVWLTRNQYLCVRTCVPLVIHW